MVEDCGAARTCPAARFFSLRSPCGGRVMNGEHPRSQKELAVRFGASREGDLQVLWEDSELMFCRGWRTGADGGHGRVLVVLPAAEHASLEPRTPHPRIWIEGSTCWRVGRAVPPSEGDRAQRTHGICSRLLFPFLQSVCFPPGLNGTRARLQFVLDWPAERYSLSLLLSPARAAPISNLSC